MPGTVKGANAEEVLMEEFEETFVDAILARNKRRTFRWQIINTSRQINELIRKFGSRGAIAGFV
jgi:hypothetical protein